MGVSSFPQGTNLSGVGGLWPPAFISVTCNSKSLMPMSITSVVAGLGCQIAGGEGGFLPGARDHTSADTRDRSVYKDVAIAAGHRTSGHHKAFMDTCLEVSCGTDQQPSP